MKDIHLKAFVEKLNDIQQERKEKPLSQEEMKIIAESLGMNEQDWKAVRESFQAHLDRASSFLKHENWEDAIIELEQALILQRNDEYVLYGLALAYMNRWREYRKKQDNERAENFIRQVLQLFPQNAQAARLLSDFRKEEKSYSQKKRQQRMVSILSFGAVLIALSIMFLFIFRQTPQQSSDFKDSIALKESNNHQVPESIITSQEIETPQDKKIETPQDKKKDIVKPDTPIQTIKVEDDGSKNVDVQWVENELSSGITFQLDEAMLNVYPESYSLEAKIRAIPVNQEVSFLKLKFGLW
jgi:tetratricopeptide (TPR) repeat protein